MNLGETLIFQMLQACVALGPKRVRFDSPALRGRCGGEPKHTCQMAHFWKSRTSARTRNSGSVVLFVFVLGACTFWPETCDALPPSASRAPGGRKSTCFGLKLYCSSQKHTQETHRTNPQGPREGRRTENREQTHVVDGNGRAMGKPLTSHDIIGMSV